MQHSAAKEAWMGKAIYVGAGTYTEIEEPMLRLEKEWLGVENAVMFPREQELDYVTEAERTHKCTDTAKTLLGAVEGTSWSILLLPNVSVNLNRPRNESESLT
jgi:hypothetical protein